MSNPTTTDFNIIIQSNSDLFSIIVTDIYGRKAFERKSGVSEKYSFGKNFTSGTYIVRVIQGKNMQTLKVIKGR